LFDHTVLINKDVNVYLVEKLRVEEESIVALENVLGYNISKLEELRPHQKNLKFFALSGYEDSPDLVNLEYWTDRIDNTQTGIEKREENIARVYNKLYSQILLKVLEGEKLDTLENFFFQSSIYIERIRCGEMSFGELVEKYDWEKEQYKGME